MKIDVRPARQDDIPDIEVLIEQLGYTMVTDALRARLSELDARDSDAVLLAVADGRALGLIALHWAPMLHISATVARITTLVVRDEARGRGVGRILVDAGAALAREAGCETLELTTSLRRTEAQAFYQAIGFTASSLRLHRALA